MDYLHIIALGLSGILLITIMILIVKHSKLKTELNALQDTLVILEDNFNQAELTHELEIKRLTAETEFAKEEGLESANQLHHIQSNLENVSKQLRNVEARNLELESLVTQDRPTQSARQVSYQMSDAEVARKIQDAIEPWRIQVLKLESELDLLKIELDSPFGRPPIAANTDEISKQSKEMLDKAQSENMDLQIKLTRTTNAYQELKNKLQQAEVYVARLNKAHETEISQIKKQLSAD